MVGRARSRAADEIGRRSDVLSGISFLGAGAIFSGDRTQRGLTTAASLLGTAGIGVACGLRHDVLAAVVTLIFLLTLGAVGWLEGHLFGRSREDVDEG